MYRSGTAEKIFMGLERNHIHYDLQKISGEPTAEQIDSLCAAYRDALPKVIVAIGGGSVIDSAKALSVMLKESGSIKEFVGPNTNKQLSGQKIPTVVAPTTAGTGSEMTISVIADYGENSFKSSLRNDIMLPDCSIIDPTLALTCPLSVNLYSGIDAFCQLIEAYTSDLATEITDPLVLNGIEKIAHNIYKACTYDTPDLKIRSEMAYAAMVSGIGILNASTTVIHGFASAIGGLYPITHGAICASVMYGCTLINMQRLQKYAPNSNAAMKFARIGSILSGIDYSYEKQDVLLRAVSDSLRKMTAELKIPKLSQLGVQKDDFYKIISSVKLNGNPTKLAESDLLEILERSY